MFCVVSAYKDPVENQRMKKILDKIITGFFVGILGILWYCSTKYDVKPNRYNVIIYDVFGNEVKLDEIRTDFSTIKVTQSFITEYQKRFPHYDFTMALEMPEIKRKNVLKIFKKN